MRKDFPNLLSKTVDKEFQKNNRHYLPTFRALKEVKTNRKERRKVKDDELCDIDDFLMKEIAYSRIEKQIKAYRNQKLQEKVIAYERAK